MSRMRLAVAAVTGTALTLALTACGAGSDPLAADNGGGSAAPGAVSRTRPRWPRAG